MKKSAINDLLKVMAKLRSPSGCPWDREQDHMTLRRHAIEEFYELIDAIENRDDHEMAEELGLFTKYGVDVEMHREVGWATIRDKIIYRELDAAQAPAGLVVAS